MIVRFRSLLPLLFCIGASIAAAQSAQLPTGPRLKDLVNRPDTQILYVGSLLNDNSGSSTDYYPAFTDVTNYELVAGREFNLLTGENSMKWKTFQPSQGTFNYSVPNADAEFASDNNSQFHGAILIGGHFTYQPSWVADITDAATLTSAMYAEIDALAGYFRSSIPNHFPVQIWQVVNEAFNPNASQTANSDWTKGLRNGETLTVSSKKVNCPLPGHTNTGTFTNSGYDNFLKVIGSNYIESAFRQAHADSPSAQLIYNDIGDGESNSSVLKSQYIAEMVTDFVNPSRVNGAVPIFGIGFQAHGFAGDTSAKTDQVRQTFQKLSDLGVGIYITEMDDAVNGVTDITANNDLLDKQARNYHNYLDAAIRVPGLRSIQVWGINDNHTFHNGETDQTTCIANNMPEPLLFDGNSNPKPAYYAVQDALATQYRLETVSNNGFESGSLSPWVARNGGTFTLSTSTAHSGTTSVKITGRTVPNSGPSQDVTSQITSQGAGRYFLRGWIKVPSGTTTAQLTLRIQDETGTNFYSTPAYNISTSWTLVSGWVPVKWTKKLTQVILYAETTGTGAPDFFLDDVTLSDGTILNNGCFENGISGWTNNFSGTLAATSSSTDTSAGTTTFFYGSGGAQVTGRSQPYHGIGQDITAELLASGPGTYSVSGMMKLFSGQPAGTGEIRLRLTYTDGTTHYYSVTAPVGSDKWYRILGSMSITWTNLQNAFLYVDTTTGTSSYYTDDLVVRQPFTP